MAEYTDKIMRLIDRTKLKMDIKKWLVQPCTPDESVMVALDDIAVSVLMTIEEQPLVKAVPLDKVKKAREEIRKLDDINPDYPMDRTIHVSRNEVLAIIDKLIAESEEKE